MTEDTTIAAATETLATQMVGQMSADDIRGFNPDAWREGVGNQIDASDGIYRRLDTDDLLDAVASMVEAVRRAEEVRS